MPETQKIFLIELLEFEHPILGVLGTLWYLSITEYCVATRTFFPKHFFHDSINNYLISPCEVEPH